jgi:hypothetical protein
MNSLISLDTCLVKGYETYGIGIIESDSNANGSYIILGNGKLICWKDYDTTYAVSNLSGADYYYNSNWTFPHAFSSTVVSCFAGLTLYNTSGMKSITISNKNPTVTTSAYWEIWSRGTGSFRASVSLMAIGMA